MLQICNYDSLLVWSPSNIYMLIRLPSNRGQCIYSILLTSSMLGFNKSLRLCTNCVNKKTNGKSQKTTLVKRRTSEIKQKDQVGTQGVLIGKAKKSKRKRKLYKWQNSIIIINIRSHSCFALQISFVRVERVD